MGRDEMEEAFFFGDAAEPNFAVLHAPKASVPALGCGIVLCPPIAHEFDFSHRMLAEWARTLANLGFHVLHFDYRGHGDSGGQFAELDLNDFADDIRRAMQILEQRAGVPCGGLTGLRLGAALAAEVWIDEGREGPLLLWEPVLQGTRYLDDLFRALLAKNMAQKSAQRMTRADIRQQISDGQTVIFEGRPISKKLVQSLEQLDLAKSCESLSQPTMLAQIRKTNATSASPQLTKWGKELADRCPTKLIVVAGPPIWFGSLVLDYAGRILPQELFEPSATWLQSHLQTDAEANRPDFMTSDQPTLLHAAGQAASDRHDCHSMSSDDGEELPVQFEVERIRCTGILHRPACGDTQRPVVVLPPQGMNLRSGWNQLYTSLGRSLARAGWSALRFDARGLGHSGGMLEYTTGADLFLAVENGGHVPDTRAAIDWLERTQGARRIILLGVCGGAVTAGWLAATDPRVVGAGLVELPLVYSRHPAQRDGQPLWRYREKLFSPAAWRKLLTLRADFRLHLRSLRMAAAKPFRQRAEPDLDERLLTDRLGEIANLPLASSVKQSCKRKIPVLFAFGTTDNAEFFQQVRSALHVDESPDVVERVVPGADHDFLQPAHSAELTHVVLEWLEQSFLPSQEVALDASGDRHPELPHA